MEADMSETLYTGLYVVPTPIGDLKDITLKALDTLAHVDLILSEDTRKSGILLKHYDLSKPQISFHAHNEHHKIASIVTRLQQGESMAVISEAGTPGLSDPGYLLVNRCQALNIPVHCLPGATAFLPALVQSGLPMHSFCFEGFLPPRKGRRQQLQKLTEEERTFILYESPHRLLKTLTELIEVLEPEREACIVRELTKWYEETKKDSLQNLLHYFTEKKPQGEFVIIVKGK